MIKFNVIDYIKGIFTVFNIIDFFILYKELRDGYIVVANINIPKIETDIYIHLYIKIKIFFISDTYKIAFHIF